MNVVVARSFSFYCPGDLLNPPSELAKLWLSRGGVESDEDHARETMNQRGNDKADTQVKTKRTA